MRNGYGIDPDKTISPRSISFLYAVNILLAWQQLANDFFAQSVIVTKSLEGRERLRSRLEPVLTEKFPGVVSRLSALELGPPVGWPLQYRVSGPEPVRVREIAYKLSAVIASDPRTGK